MHRDGLHEILACDAHASTHQVASDPIMLCLLEATGLAKTHPAKQLKSASSYAPAGSLSGAFHGHAACGRPLLRLPPPLGRRRRRRSRTGPRVGREAEVAAQGDVHEGLRAARRAQKVAAHFSAGRALRVCSPAPCKGRPLQVRVRCRPFAGLGYCMNPGPIAVAQRGPVPCPSLGISEKGKSGYLVVTAFALNHRFALNRRIQRRGSERAAETP